MSGVSTRPDTSPGTPRRAPHVAADPGLAVFRLLLATYPPAFRAAYGREMVQVVRDQRRAATAGGRSVLGFWAAVVWDVARSAPALRLDALRSWWRVRGRRRGRGQQHGPRTGGAHLPPEGGPVAARRTVAALAALGGLFELTNTGAEVWAGYRGPMRGWALAMALAFAMGGLLLAAGVVLLRGGSGAARLARGAALGCLALVVGLQLAFPFMSIFARLLGVAVPLALLRVLRRGPGPSAPAVA